MTGSDVLQAAATKMLETRPAEGQTFSFEVDGDLFQRVSVQLDCGPTLNLQKVYLFFAGLGLNGLDRQVTSWNTVPRRRLQKILKRARDDDETTAAMLHAHISLGKGHKLLSGNVPLIVARTTSCSAFDWNAVVRSSEVSNAVGSILKDDHLKVSFSDVVDDPNANVFVVVTTIDGPALRPACFTSHYKGNALPRFGGVPFRPPRAVRECIVLYVAEALIAQQKKSGQSSSALLNRTIAHLLLHAAGRDHSNTFAATI